MHAFDLFADGFPHGTPDGYKQGCHGGACPESTEGRTSCRDANMRFAGDAVYRRRVQAGMDVHELAAADEQDRADVVARRKVARSGPAEAASDVVGSAPKPRAVPAPPKPPAETPRTPKWRVQRTWVAISPEGKLHGAFGEQQHAYDFIAALLAPKSKPETRVLRRFSAAEDAQLRRLLGQGLLDQQIADVLGRRRQSVTARRNKLKLPANGVKFGATS